MTIREFEEEFSGIDRRVIESIYKEAGNYIPKLQHDWEELSAFVQNLRTRKWRFLQAQIETLHERAEGERRDLAALQLEETEQIGALVTSAEFEKALQLRSELQEKYKLLGSLEEGLKDRQRLREQIEAANTRLKATSELIEREKGALRNRVDIFNKHFSELSALLYGEEYLLHFDENDAGNISFELTAVGSNVGAGKKASQTAAFDLAYIDFLHDTKINFPKFVCHDGVETIHDNQLAALLQLATEVDGQLIVATLRDKLPPLAPEFLRENTVLELGQDDKLFGI